MGWGLGVGMGFWGGVLWGGSELARVVLNMAHYLLRQAAQTLVTHYMYVQQY